MSFVKTVGTTLNTLKNVRFVVGTQQRYLWFPLISPKAGAGMFGRHVTLLVTLQENET